MERELSHMVLVPLAGVFSQPSFTNSFVLLEGGKWPLGASPGQEKANACRDNGSTGHLHHYIFTDILVARGTMSMAGAGRGG